MTMRVLLLTATLILVAFAGCVDDSEPASEGGGSATGTSSGSRSGDLLDYEVDPDSANESQLEGAHIHDEWGPLTEKTLLDGTVQTADCADPFRSTAFLLFGAVSQQEAQAGCATWRFDAGKVVPEGTASLRIEVDATDALKQGGMQLSYDNEDVEFTRLEATTEPVMTWTLDMDPIEWDLPHSTETSWYFLLEPSGQVGVLDGEIEVFVVAERLPDWEPILGSAHIDHWVPDADHTFIEPDVYRALDTNVTVVMPSFADRIASQGEADITSVQLDDIVAPASRQVSLAVIWDEISGCPTGHVCWLVSFMNPGGSRAGAFAEPSEEGPGWAVYVYDSPEPLAPDSTYAEESVYYVTTFVRSCPEQEVPMPGSASFFNGCAGEAVATMEADARIEVEVWQSSADLGAVKQRVGLA